MYSALVDESSRPAAAPADGPPTVIRQVEGASLPAGRATQQRPKRANSRLRLARTVRRQHRALHRYRPWRVGVLLALGAMALVLNELLPEQVQMHPFAFVCAYVLFAVWYGDAWDGLGSVVLSALALADVLPPDNSLAIADPVDAIAAACFIVTSLSLVALVQRLRRAYGLAQVELAQRRRVEVALRASEERLRAEHAAADSARQLAEDALHAQDRFLSTVSHELQTPLTAVRAGLGLLEVSASARLDPSEQALLDNVRRNTEHLLRQISDLLLLNRVTAGALALDHAALDLRTVVGEALAGVQALVAEKGQTVDIDLPVPLAVWGDARRLEQVLVNLLSNAYHHTPSGTRIRVVGRACDNTVLLTVCDDGPGIAAGEVERIFEQFHRLGTAASGAGLGLAIARGIVELHGGRLWAESSPGAGVRFHVCLPRNQGAPTA